MARGHCEAKLVQGLPRRLDAAFGIRLRPEYCGLALTHCWFFSMQRVAAAGSVALFSASTFVGASAACLLFAVLAAAAGESLSAMRLSVILVAAAAVLSTLLLLAPAAPWPSAAEALLAGLCGAGLGGLYLVWGTFYQRLDIRQACYALFATFAAGSLMKIPLELVQPGLSTAILFCLLPLGSVACWAASMRRAPSPATAPAPVGGAWGRLLARYAVGVAAFSAAMGALSSFQAGYYALSPALVVMAHLIEVLAAAGLLLAVLRQREDFDFESLWMAVLAVIATGLVVVEYLPGAAARVADAILTAAQMLIVILVWFALADIAQRSGRPSDLVFGVGYTVYALPLALASYACAALGPSGRSASTLIMYVLLMAVLLLMRRRWSAEPSLFAGLLPKARGDRDGLASKVRALAAERGLTEREEEVALLYAQGRSRPFIAEALSISEHTASDHIAHAYKKLGVHSKQEFIDAVEGQRR